MGIASLAKVGIRAASRLDAHANDNHFSRRVVVHLVPTAPITITELEVFDYLIGSFAGFAANDNERPKPYPDAIRDPPSDAATLSACLARRH